MFLFHLILTFVLHVMNGVYATILAWVQSPNHGKMQIFTLLASSNFIGMLFYVPMQLIRVRKEPNKISKLFICYHLKGYPRSAWILTFFTATFWVLANFSTVYSFRYASHPSVIQGLSLLMPFMVFFISKVFKISKKLPRFIIPAFFISVGGCLMMILGVNKSQDDNELPNTNNTVAVILGILFDIFAAFFFSFQQKICRTYKINAEVLLILIGQIYLPLTLALSFILKEDWGVFKNLGVEGWMFMLYITIGIMCLSRLGQTQMVIEIGAALYSTVQAIRLPSTMVSDYVVLKANPHWPLQYIGAIIVFISISLFLGYQAYLERKTKNNNKKNNKKAFFDPSTSSFIEESEDDSETNLLGKSGINYETGLSDTENNFIDSDVSIEKGKIN
ncbi:dmt family transporter [Anaeramoeba ignava]|uniref:Dmt family transporter n=1 Tax=Anaeramoeba ignava TaxID=1746090 RepID=A0A9Q0LAJ2_ANAIG|nr:dmt family transporter [Anaeramoeba ignava]